MFKFEVPFPRARTSPKWFHSLNCQNVEPWSSGCCWNTGSNVVFPSSFINVVFHLMSCLVKATLLVKCNILPGAIENGLNSQLDRTVLADWLCNNQSVWLSSWGHVAMPILDLSFDEILKWQCLRYDLECRVRKDWLSDGSGLGGWLTTFALQPMYLSRRLCLQIQWRE